VAKGGRIIGARRSSSRERRVFGEGCAVSFVLRRGRGARRVCRRKAPWIGKAHAFHEAPAEPVLAASEQTPGDSKKSEARRTARRRRQGCQRRSVSSSHGGRKRPRVNIDRSPKWESRREARFSPASFASDGPEPTGACPARLRTSGGAREKRRSRERARSRKVPGREWPRVARNERSASHGTVTALGNGGARVLELERFRSAEVDRTHRRSRRPWALPSASRTRAT